MGDNSNSLSINWSFGFSKDVIGGVQSMTTADKRAIFLISSHSGVIYDYEHRTQVILQGHCNCITCCAVSKDKRWIVTADSGDDSILVIWDALTGAPVKTLFLPHKKGIISLDISEDALFICTLSATDLPNQQEIAIWAWTRETDSPLLRREVLTSDVQHSIKFDSEKQSEFSTTGSKTVSFWNWNEYSIEGYMGKVSKTDFGHYSGKFTCTVYLSGTESALSSTDDGFVIVWETQYTTVLLEDPADRLMRTASKVIRLVEYGIGLMSIVNSYVAVACLDGSIRFFDYSLRLEAWFEDMAAGAVTSLSFSVQDCPFAVGEGGSPGLSFWVPDFIVGTADAFVVGMESQLFQEVRVEDRRGTLLVQGMADDISSLACHPYRPLVAVACYNGTLQVWDYELKLLMNMREFNYRGGVLGSSNEQNTNRVDLLRGVLRPQCLAFDPSGELLAVGFTSGHVKLLRVDTFEDASSYAPTPETVVAVKFSPSSVYLAAYDSGHHVLIFRRAGVGASQSAGDDASEFSDVNSEIFREGEENSTFVYLGRAKAHRSAITGIEFGVREGREVLISIGEDRRCVEFNLPLCSVRMGLSSADLPVRIELTARPTALLWHPRVGDDVEDRFIIANDEFKLKEFNADSKQCRKTTLAPTFGGPLNKLLLLPLDNSIDHSTTAKIRYYAYATSDRVIGLGCLPLTGNPTKVMGLVAHPSRVTSIALSHDGLYLFSSGGADLTTNMWAVNTEALCSTPLPGEEYAKEPLAPYVDLLDGGAGGELHHDIIDYFYFCQLRSQGENSMTSRKITGHVLLEEVPSIMRAVGYYPTEEEATNMINEVRYKHFMLSGETISEIDLEDFIKLYINHRPAVPLSNLHIETAFAEIRNYLRLSGNDVAWPDLKRLLTSEGEVMSMADLDVCMSALIGNEATMALEENKGLVSAGKFSDEILGFEYYETAL